MCFSKRESLVRKTEYADILVFIYYLFDKDDTEEEQESEGHSQGEAEDDVQPRCEAGSSQSPGLFTCQAATESQNKNQPKNTLLLGKIYSDS